MRALLQARQTRSLLAALAGAGATLEARAGDVTASAATVTFDIKPQSLASALNAFAVQSHQQILFTPATTASRRTNAIVLIVTNGGDADVAYRIARALQQHYTKVIAPAHDMKLCH